MTVRDSDGRQVQVSQKGLWDIVTQLLSAFEVEGYDSDSIEEHIVPRCPRGWEGVEAGVCE